MPASRDIYREQVAYLARQTPFNTVTTGGVALFTAAIIWHSATDLWLFLWLLAHLVLTSIAYFRWRRGLSRYRWPTTSTNITRKNGNRLLPLAAGWAALSGAVWGAAVFFLPELPPLEQLALLIVMAGMASGASSTLAAVPMAAAGFILADLTPLIIYFFLQGTFVYSALGVMAAIFTLALLSSTRIVYGIFLEAWGNRRENAALLDQIRAERNAAAESLMLSEERYSDVVETIGDMVANTDQRGNFLFTNRAWRETLGYSGADLANLRFLDIVDDNYKEIVLALTKRVGVTKLPETVEFILRAKDRRPIWVEANANPMFENGKFVRLNGVFRNIGLRKEVERTQLEIQAELQQKVTEATRDLAAINASLQSEVAERRQAERAWRNSETQLRLILDSTVEAIYGVNANGRCMFANAACARMLGYEEASELLGVDMHVLAHTQGPQTSGEDCAICGVHRSARRQQADDQIFMRRGGGAFPVEYSAGSIIRDGAVVGGVVAFLDITQRRVAEERLRQSQKMEAVGQLTGGIAHDFNNLLAIIVGNLDLLSASYEADSVTPGGATQRRTASALRAAERATALTQRLLSFSRKKMLSPQLIDPGQTVTEMGEMIRAILDERITMDIRTHSPLWEVVLDPAQFENALLNLAINARDAMAGGGALTIEIMNVKLDAPLQLPRLRVPAGDYVKLQLRDTGSGITPEIMDKVFDPFFTTKEIGYGTGLGMSMVFGFVEQSNGYISLESEPGRGTSVTIYLPRATAAEAEIHKREAPAVNGIGVRQITPPENIRILVVEDDPGVRQTSVAQIEALGYNVLSAQDGPGALDLFAATPGIDLVYTDIMMPNGMNGPALAVRLRALDPEIKVLLCTGYDGDAQTQDQGHGFRVLQKPVRNAQLAAALREMLNA